jgi:hypothetical protein
MSANALVAESTLRLSDPDSTRGWADSSFEGRP